MKIWQTTFVFLIAYLGLGLCIPQMSPSCSLLVNDTTSVSFPIAATSLPFTISALVKVAANPVGSVILASVTIGDLIAELSYSGGQLLINENSFQANQSSFTLAENTWHYLLFRFQDNEIKATLNTTTVTLTANYTLDGEANTITFEGLQGNLKDVAVYNGLLPENYWYLRFYETTPFTGSVTVLNYWRLEEISGLILYDTIGSNQTTVSISSESIRQCSGSSSKILCKAGEHYSAGSCISCSSSCLICTNATHCDVCNPFTVLTANACPTQTGPTAGTLILNNTTPVSGVDSVTITASGWTDTNGISTYGFYYYFDSDTSPIFIASSSSATATITFPYSLTDKAGHVVCKATNTLQLSTSLSTTFTLTKSTKSASEMLTDTTIPIVQQAIVLAEVSGSYGKSDSSTSKCNSTYCSGNGVCSYTSAGTKTCLCYSGSYGSICNLNSAAYQELLTKAKEILTIISTSTDEVTSLSVLYSVSTYQNNLDLASATNLLTYTNTLFNTKASLLTDSSYQQKVIGLVSNIAGLLLHLNSDTTTASDANTQLSRLNTAVTGMAKILAGSVVTSSTPVAVSTDYLDISVSLIDAAGTTLNLGTGSNSPKVQYTSEVASALPGTQTVATAIGSKYNPYMPNQPDNVTSTDTLTLTFYDHSTGTDASLSGLTDGITLTIPATPNVDEITSNTISDAVQTCAYFDETTNAWKTDGVTTVSSDSTGVSCKTTHTTPFSSVTSYSYSAKRADGFPHHAVSYFVILWGLTIILLIYWLICSYKKIGKVEAYPAEPVHGTSRMGDMSGVSKAEMITDREEIANKSYFKRIGSEFVNNNMFFNIFRDNRGANLNGVRIAFFFLGWSIMAIQAAFLVLANRAFYYNTGASVWMGFAFALTTNIFISLLSTILFAKHIAQYLSGTDVPASAYSNPELSARMGLLSIALSLILIAACTGGAIGITVTVGYDISDYWIGAAMSAIIIDFVVYELIALIIVPCFKKKSAIGRMLQAYRRSRNVTFTVTSKFVKVK